jgi:hypothetical protein
MWYIELKTLLEDWAIKMPLSVKLLQLCSWFGWLPLDFLVLKRGALIVVVLDIHLSLS